MTRLEDGRSDAPSPGHRPFSQPVEDFLTASHYDQQHNLYLQLRGSKKFLLFDVTCAPVPAGETHGEKHAFSVSESVAFFPQRSEVVAGV